MEFVAVGSSGRYDRRLRLVKQATRFYRRQENASIINHTEMTEDNRVWAFRQVKDWGFNRAVGSGADSDPVTEWKQSVWDLENEDTIRLSNLRYKRETGRMSAGVFAAKTHLTHNSKHLMVYAGHMPQWKIESRRGVWEDAMTELTNDTRQELKRDKNLNVLWRFDWNLDYRDFQDRTLLNHKFDSVGLRSNWFNRMPKSGGTHGHNLIDSDAHNMKILASSLLRDDPSSDHRPHVSTYRI